jgi:hypothetical protein
MAVAHTIYRCLATIEVPADQAALYDQLICEASSVFTDRKWHLLVPGQKAAIFDTGGKPPGLVRKLLHLWSIPDFNTLPSVMDYAADDPNYVKAQALTCGEMQNLYTTLRWDNPLGLPDIPIGFYMMETLRIVNNVQARADFAAYMDTAVYKMNDTHGWRIVFAGNVATGVIDEYTHIWAMSERGDLEQAITTYRSEPRWLAAVSWAQTSLWTARPLPCFEHKGMSALPPKAG